MLQPRLEFVEIHFHELSWQNVAQKMFVSNYLIRLLHEQITGQLRGRLGKCTFPSIIPRPSTPPVFDCLQYAKLASVQK